ncbi:MAG TPA: hypothetical protein VIL25_05170, partial [Vicinamibacterales bacterium]
VQANAVGFSVSAGVAASGAVAVAETGGRARAAILDGAAVTADTVAIQATSTATPLAAAGGFAGSAFAAAGVMIAETVAGHGAHAEASGVITTSQLDVEAQATRAGVADASFVGISLFTGEVGFEAEKTAGETVAVIGEAADITITGGGDANVSAVSTDTADPHIVDAAVGAFMIGAQATSALIESSTRARVAGRVSARNVEVASSAIRTADAVTDILNVSILTLNGVLLDNIVSLLPEDLPIPVAPSFDTVATATIAGDTEAFLGAGADVTATGTLSLAADSISTASASNLSAGATLVNVADTASHATAGGSTRVHIDEGAAIDVGALATTAQSDNDATAGAAYAGASGVNVALADVVAKTDHLTAAYIGPAKGVAPGSDPATTLRIANGGLDLRATSTNDARVGEITLDASLVTVEKVKPEANAGGATRAHVGGAFDVDADSVDVAAQSTNVAVSNAFAFDLNLLDIDLNERSARTTHLAEAFVGPSATLDLGAAPLVLDAHSDNDASVLHAAPVDLGVVDLDFASSTAAIEGATRAYVAEGSTLAAGSLAANASAGNEAAIDRFQFGASVVGLQQATPTARTAHEVAAFIGPAAGGEPNAGLAGTISLAGGIALNATSVNDATVDEVSIGAGVVGIDLAKPTMTVGGTTRTHVGGNYT